MEICLKSVVRDGWLAWQPTRILPVAAMVLLAGCSALLPSSEEETIASWDQFDQAKAAYDKISLGESRAELKELGFDVANSPNIAVLNYLDVASKVQSIPMAELDTGLQQCLQRREECMAYVLDLRKLKAKRVGNFMADFFNFRRKTDSSGWRFNALLVMINDQVTYKLWSGTPRIELHEEKRNPLGPLQGTGGQVDGLLPWQ
ncbi:MAG: hypothetical protein ACSLFH_03075 [Desulfuromonadales bacterium]